ncbi:hypothetical protein HanRHA438_Chr01g0017721 [Helianthus annuus]|nr:hypothetical protein HanRHA438_Chr01g0017721 [Helianthus annuus]
MVSVCDKPDIKTMSIGDPTKLNLLLINNISFFQLHNPTQPYSIFNTHSQPITT